MNSRLSLVALALGSCRVMPPTEATVETEVETVFVELDSPRLLRRMSLDLTGELPTLEELEAVEGDPALLEDYRDAYLDDPRFEEQTVFLLQEHLLTAVDEYFSVTYADYNLDPSEEYAWERSIGQEPLRLMARVAAEDLHWSEVVTADWTMATEVTAAIWPLEGYPEGEEGWHQVVYNDYRPAAGVLATNGLWWKYRSDDYNQNRSRAAAVARLLVCEDLLLRPVSFENASSLLDAENVTEMVRTEDACLACHSTLEPLAAALYGFHWTNDYVVQEMERYHPEREIQGPLELEVDPAWWGEPITGLGELGWAIADDVRFYRCAVETFTRVLLRRPLRMGDRDEVDRVFEDFIDGDARAKVLIRSVMDLPAYRAGGFVDGVDPDTVDHEKVVRALGPRQLARIVESFTGFQWIYDGFDMMDSDTWGFRVLAGGVDGDGLTQPVLTPSLTSVVVIKRLAEAAAQVEVEDHLGDGGSFVLSAVDPAWTASDSELEETVADLYFLFTGIRADDDTLGSYVDLWSEVADISDNETAWGAVLMALLRDPLFVTY